MHRADLYKYCNSKTKEMANLQLQVMHEFILFEKELFTVSSQFIKNYPPTLLHMDRDSFFSYLCSVTEANQHQEKFCSSLTKQKSRLFQLNVPKAAVTGSPPVVNFLLHEFDHAKKAIICLSLLFTYIYPLTLHDPINSNDLITNTMKS
jgi:hypothetical protein